MEEQRMKEIHKMSVLKPVAIDYVSRIVLALVSGNFKNSDELVEEIEKQFKETLKMVKYMNNSYRDGGD